MATHIEVRISQLKREIKTHQQRVKDLRLQIRGYEKQLPDKGSKPEPPADDTGEVDE